jgi:WD40 repeat protein
MNYYFISIYLLFTTIIKSSSNLFYKLQMNETDISMSLSLGDNLIIKRRKNISKLLDDFFPNDLSKLIGEYDYYIAGTPHTIKQSNASWDLIVPLSDNRLIVTNFDKINIWNLQTGKWDILRSMDYRNAFINYIVKLPDDRIVVASHDGSLKIWNQQTEIYDLIIKAHNKVIYYINTFRDECDNLLLISGSFDDTIKIWDLTNGNCKTIITNTVHADRLFSVLPDKRLLIQSCDDSVYKIKIWNLKNKKYDIIFDIDFVLYCHCFLPNGQMATGLSNGKIKIWNTHTMSKIQTLTGHSEYVQYIAVLPDGRLISGSADGTLKIWNLQTGECDMILIGHQSKINCIVVLLDGRILSVSGVIDKLIKIWS